MKTANNAPVTKDQLGQGLNAIIAIADAIKEFGEVPSGRLYATIMGRLDLATYEKLIDILKNTGLIEVDQSRLLRWIGPK